MKTLSKTRIDELNQIGLKYIGLPPETRQKELLKYDIEELMQIQEVISSLNRK